jgi:cation transport regulator ChaB
MTCRKDFTLPAEFLERVSKQGLNILPELIQEILNAAMQAEWQQYLKAEPYQHNEEREGHANGYKPKTVQTRVGSITFSIPQVREGGFYPEALEKGLRSERALLLAMAEMYMQGGLDPQGESGHRAAVRGGHVLDPGQSCCGTPGCGSGEVAQSLPGLIHLPICGCLLRAGAGGWADSPPGRAPSGDTILQAAEANPPNKWMWKVGICCYNEV